MPGCSMEKDIHAYEGLDLLGKRIRKKTGAISTKEIIDDIRD